MRKRFLAIGLLAYAGLVPVLLPAPVQGAETEPAATAPPTTSAATDPILAELAAAAKTVITVTGTYVQKTWNPSDPPDEPEVTNARFAIEAPDKYNRVETKPDRSGWRRRSCSDGVTCAEFEQTSDDVMPDTKKRPAGESDADLRRVIACVRGDFTQLAADFAVAATALPGGGYGVTLTTSNAELAHDLTSIVVRFDAEKHVAALEIMMASKTRIVVTIASAEYGTPIPPETFVIPDLTPSK